jgi:hypothetical protein
MEILEDRFARSPERLHDQPARRRPSGQAPGAVVAAVVAVAREGARLVSERARASVGHDAGIAAG